MPVETAATLVAAYAARWEAAAPLLKE
jgi:hypothetical protein